MGKHAAPHTSPLGARAAKRATAVSLGTVVLCLGAAAPALAANTDPSPAPLPIPIPKPVTDLVQQLSDATGLPNPLQTTSTTKTHHHHKASTKKAQQQTAPPATTSRRPHRPAASDVTAPAYVPSAFTITQLNDMRATRTAAMAGRTPAVANNHRVVRFVPAENARALPALPGDPTDNDTARILWIAVAIMACGALASGHLKVSQRRTVAW